MKVRLKYEILTCDDDPCVLLHDRVLDVRYSVREILLVNDCPRYLVRLASIVHERLDVYLADGASVEVLGGGAVSVRAYIESIPTTYHDPTLQIVNIVIKSEKGAPEDGKNSKDDDDDEKDTLGEHANIHLSSPYHVRILVPKRRREWRRWASRRWPLWRRAFWRLETGLARPIGNIRTASLAIRFVRLRGLGIDDDERPRVEVNFGATDWTLGWRLLLKGHGGDEGDRSTHSVRSTTLK